MKNKTFITAEIGINHNGDLNIAKKLIDMAKLSGCDAVKFQKRTIDIVYDKKTLDSDRESPWGKTQREQKMGLEFNENEYDEINAYCKNIKIDWFFNIIKSPVLHGFNRCLHCSICCSHNYRLCRR